MVEGPIAAFVEPHLSAPDLRRITLSGGGAGAGPGAIRKAAIRPVEVGGRRALQVVTYDDRRSTTTNVADGTDPLVRQTLALPFRNVVVERSGEIIEGRVTKKGALVTSRTVTEAQPVVLTHDRQKSHPIPQDAPFLEVLGISANGRVKPSRQAKYRQINDFVRLLDAASTLDEVVADAPVRVADLGCGNAYLTFATYHHLVENRGVRCRLVGVDRNAELVERGNERARSLGWDGLSLHEADVASYEPADRPHVVIALHACDTASDHALAAVVRWEADLGMVAPCCHHHLQAQLRASDVGPGEALLLRHGILKERLGDTVTDAARATVMRLLGFDVDVVEFVSPDHTPRNILIRAARRSLPVPPGMEAAYEQLVERWGVRPYLAELLRDQLGLS